MDWFTYFEVCLKGQVHPQSQLCHNLLNLKLSASSLVLLSTSYLWHQNSIVAATEVD